MPVAGNYFDAHSSRPLPATLRFWPDQHLTLTWQDTALVQQQRELSRSDVQISERLGNIARRVYFGAGEVFETTDNDGIDRALAAWGTRPTLIHRLEQRWPLALGSLVALALLSVLFVRFGLPAIVNYAAKTLPPAIDRALGTQSLDILDRLVLAPSKLPLDRQRELRQRFAAMTAGLGDGHYYRLELRHAPKVGPNAFALPSGIVVMTDELVDLSQHDEELVAVLAHEIGHVRGRHALRQLLQSAGISALAFAILGDVTSISALAGAVPALIEAKFSRDFEREADAFAKDWLSHHGIRPTRFDDILCRMERQIRGSQEQQTPSKQSGVPAPTKRAERASAAFWSTHPATDERARCQ